MNFQGQDLTTADWAREIRRVVLEQSHRAHVGHIGSCLCVADILAVIYRDVLRADSPNDPDRDRFILSKGHAALALYGALFLKSWLSEADLNQFFENGSLLGVHPDVAVPGIDFSTGSLGMGLGFGAGAALAAKLSHSERKVYVLISDAECNEGSLWEAVHFAAHHKLDNLIAILDDNGQQAFGYTRDVLNIGPLSDRFSQTGWESLEVNGHDVNALHRSITAPSIGKPRLVCANTIFGKGVSYMEGQIPWHYMPMSEPQFEQAIFEVKQS